MHQKIITNISIPNKQIDFSPEKNNAIQNTDNKNIPTKKDSQKYKLKTDKNSENNKENDDFPNNFTQLCNENFRNDKNNSLISPSLTKTTSLNNQSNKKIFFTSFNSDMLGFINKVRNSPKDVLEDIDNIIKNNLKKIDDKEYLISESTNEMIKLNIYMDKIKENILSKEGKRKMIISRKKKII